MTSLADRMDLRGPGLARLRAAGRDHDAPGAPPAVNAACCLGGRRGHLPYPFASRRHRFRPHWVLLSDPWHDEMRATACIWLLIRTNDRTVAPGMAGDRYNSQTSQ
jgi:hypothetical protein